MLILVAYDIVDDKRRTKLAKALCRFGMRVQYSLFECDLNPRQQTQMVNAALKFIDQEQDSLRIYRICQACAKEIISFGVKKGWEDADVIVA